MRVLSHKILFKKSDFGDYRYMRQHIYLCLLFHTWFRYNYLFSQNHVANSPVKTTFNLCACSVENGHGMCVCSHPRATNEKGAVTWWEWPEPLATAAKCHTVSLRAGFLFEAAIATEIHLREPAAFTGCPLMMGRDRIQTGSAHRARLAQDLYQK